jgi:hypothetical protein
LTRLDLARTILPMLRYTRLRLRLPALLASLGASLLVACTSSDNGGSGPPAEDAGPGFTGTYTATFTGTYQNTSPNTESGTSSESATITVKNVTPTEIELSWDVAPNPPSGTAVFVMSGSTGILLDAGVVANAADAGVDVSGSCLTGTINGNTQTNCCTACTITFSGNTFTQPNAGNYAGTTPQGVAYRGTYTGTWTGTLQ